MSERKRQLLKMLEAEPGDVFCLYGLAMEHAKAGEHAEAERYFDEVIARDPGYCYAYFHKAKVQEEQGDTSGAAATLREGVGQAKARGDGQAVSELEGYLDELS